VKTHQVEVTPSLPPAIAALDEIAGNVWQAWNPDAAALFARLDPELWQEVDRNPVALLRRLPQEALAAAAEDESFVAMVARVQVRLEAYLSSPGWFPAANPAAEGIRVAYFSLEFGLDPGIPLYSGGLGILAGDHLKSASDLGIPLVGVGLLYRNGYFHQYLGPDGGQRERYPATDWADLPLEDVRDPAGEPVVVRVELADREIVAAVRRIQVGRIPLILLDADVPENPEDLRAVTSALYGGDKEMRIRQELLLGVGGMRALRAAGLAPTALHMNEGHSALLALERVRMLIEDEGVERDAAFEQVAASTVFTTHTPVPAGNETFALDLARTYLEPVAARIGLSWDELAAMGAGPDGEHVFGLTPLALRTSGFANGVAELHGRTSRRMWRGLWPGLPEREVPITSVTNGIHTASWLSPELHELLERYIGPGLRDRPDDATLWERVEAIPPGELWRAHELRREALVFFARQRLHEQLARRGSRRVALRGAEEALRPDALTICFARRFATYKRAGLLFRDPDRLARLLGDEERPVQVVVAGKAHPHDQPAKDLMREIVGLAQEPGLRERVVFIEDYDMHVARFLVQGADVWLNVPRRPLEASGTSGMKAAANGVLNLSVLDGWWVEGYAPDCGWAIGGGEEYEDPDEQDAVEGEALYALLEREVVPLFHLRDASGRPREWIQMMATAIRRLGAAFSTHRMVREYAERAYVPAHAAAGRLGAEHCAGAVRLAAWRARIEETWPQVAVRAETLTDGPVQVGSAVPVAVHVTLGEVPAEEVRVEVVAGAPDGAGGIEPERVVRARPDGRGERPGETRYSAEVPAEASGRLALAARAVPEPPAGLGPTRPFLVTWED
jgi:starch phosphorylase